MSGPTYHYSRLVPAPIEFQWTAEDGITPINCSTFSCAVTQTTLPWTPAITAFNAVQGWFRIAAPSEAQAAGLLPGKRYGLSVVMRNAANAPVQDFELVLVAV